MTNYIKFVNVKVRLCITFYPGNCFLSFCSNGEYRTQHPNAITHSKFESTEPNKNNKTNAATDANSRKCTEAGVAYSQSREKKIIIIKNNNSTNCNM